MKFQGSGEGEPGKLRREEVGTLGRGSARFRESERGSRGSRTGRELGGSFIAPR